MAHARVKTEFEIAIAIDGGAVSLFSHGDLSKPTATHVQSYSLLSTGSAGGPNNDAVGAADSPAPADSQPTPHSHGIACGTSRLARTASRHDACHAAASKCNDQHKQRNRLHDASERVVAVCRGTLRTH